MACEYFISDNNFTEKEIKDFIKSGKIDELIESGEIKRFSEDNFKNYLKESIDSFVEAKIIDFSKIPPKPPKPPREQVEAENESFKQRMRSFYKNVINRAKGLTADEKKLLQDNPNALYDVLPHAESRKIAKELIDEIGVEKAILEATDKSSGLAPVERVMILGAAMDYYSGLAKEQAKLGNEKSVIELANKEIDAQEKMLQIADTLATMGTDYGRAISIFNEVYKLSNIALERKLKNKVDEVNKARNANATQQAKDIAKIVSNDEAPISEAAQDLTETQLMREVDAMRKVKELEKEVEDLKKEILQRDNAAKGTKKNPLKIKRVTNDTEYDKRLKEFQQRQRSILSKDDVTDLTYFGLYHIENGLTKFADWYNVMSRKFSGFKDSLHDIYKNARDKAVSSGADLKEFDTDENISKFFEDKKADSDAKKMLAATKRAAKAKLKEIEENDPTKARKVAPKFAAERIRKDAENNLDMPSTKKEQKYLKKLVQVINQKAKEYYKEKKENVKNINDILAFAIANGKKDFDIWERTKVEVENQIDADENLTEEQKAEVRDFLNDYTESIFDTLLTKNQIEETIRQKLIENGFGIEKVVNGKVVKSVDWNKIIGNAKNIKEAKEKIVKSIADLGINLDEAKGEIDAILNQFDSKVTDKKTAAINAYLNKGIVNKVKSALGKKQANKTQISKLVEMNNKGILDDERVKDVLAEELGIISLSKEDLAKVRELSTQIDRDDIPEFMRKQFQEQLQYLFDSKSGNLPYLENRESVMANRLSSVYNQIQNSTGFFRVISTLATIAAKTKNPKIAARVFGRELLNSIQDAKTILLKGRVSRGSSFSDLTMTTEGEPRVRYLEQGKGKFLSGSFLGRPLYVKMGNKSIDVNPINQAYSRVKYIQRLLEAVDTPSSGISSGLTQYWQIGKAIDKYYPELSPQEKSKKVWDIMYSLDREAEVPNAIQMLKNAGVDNPTQAEINRTINEKQERLRNDLMVKEFNKQLNSIKPIAETKLKDDGNANPTSEQIEEQAYKMLGYDEPLDVVARGERQAARETGKSTTVGITSVLLMPLDGMQKRISMAMRKNTTKSGQIAANSVDAVASQLFPFAHSIGRWTEMQLELTPYGALKGLLYKSGLARDIQGGDKSKISRQEYSELGDDYIIRSVLGAGYTVAAMGAIGLAKKIAGDDDEAEDAIIGTNKEEKFTQERVESVGKPKESIRIGGHNLPIQLLGNEGVILGMYADYLKKRKDPAYAEKSMLYISAAVVMNSLSESGWYSNAAKYGGVASSIIKGKEETYEPALGKVMGGLIGSQVPFNRGQVELATVLNPQSKSSKEFGVNLQNQFSIVRAFDNTKPNFDFRGRTYEYGDIYVNSADGVMKMFSKAKYGDKIDEFLADINFAATDAYRTTKEEDNYKYAIENKDGTKRFMTNEEYYDFKYAAAKEFDRLIKLNYENVNSQKIDVNGKEDKIETEKLKKELASYLWNKSKEKSIKEIQLKSTGVGRKIDENELDKEADINFLKKDAKINLKGVDSDY